MAINSYFNILHRRHKQKIPGDADCILVNNEILPDTVRQDSMRVALNMVADMKRVEQFQHQLIQELIQEQAYIKKRSLMLEFFKKRKAEKRLKKLA